MAKRCETVGAEELAQRFHQTYERLAPRFGYETREETSKPWAEVPEDNRELMVATARELLEWLRGEEPKPVDEPQPQPEVEKWWPEEVKCAGCGKVWPMAEEPASYAEFCPECGYVMVIHPVERKGSHGSRGR